LDLSKRKKIEPSSFFSPYFYFKDLPLTSRRHAEECREAALEAGLNRVRIGNIHLLGRDY